MEAPAYAERYRQVMSIEQTKNSLIEELLQRVAELENALQRQKLDHEREKHFNREIQIHEMELMNEITRMNALMHREPYMIVLLDGHGLIFKEEFLKQGEQGGKNAAKELSTALQDYVTTHFPNIASPKIVTMIYMNVKGLAELCIQGGIKAELPALEAFVRGFNGNGLLSDIVDVGTGKNKASDKIEGRVTLIEGVPLQGDMKDMKPSYRVAKFTHIFRETNIASVSAPQETKSRSSLTPSPVQHATPLSKTSTNTTMTSNSPALPTSSRKMPKSEEFQPIVRSTRSKALSSPPPKIVEQNKYRQRVDRFDIKTIPKDDLSRMKKLKLCNYFYLQGECPIEDCRHDHSRKLTKSEYHILMVVARMTPCRYKFECDDPDCMYGHRCPHSEPGKKECVWGSTCRFDAAAHGVDTTIVKVTKI
ncbi:CCCH zinc finger protein [Aspergillus novofumigatus IBT 16806]|uniref:C-x8-C-x5-C-x3-H type zinc finger protein n=1 Tax=Aspergillus novofumigatus (strain IBT 16806) TaxID=1392255 RepID=A0A2I1CP88_ASPN1|nr:C-x8-C-x5-C-x3-H type zinc finger protein [Aspergillus novofumigatus IBT 16806]PKX99440.1 C-x8-C-x5-C-x3-H type zinc finger protein [Aspergillus novofumigatus IBT 16806]